MVIVDPSRSLAEVVTPEAARRLANTVRDRHPGLQALDLRAGAAQAQVEGIRRWADPTLRTGGIGYTSRGPMASEEGDIALGISQPLPVFGKESAARAVAKAEAKTSREAVEARLQTLQRDLLVHLLQLAWIHRKLELAEADRLWLERILETQQARQASGSVPAAPLIRLRNELSEAETRLNLQHIEARDTTARINRVLGQAIDDPVSRWELPPKAGPIAYRPEWTRQALTAEPRLRIARLQSTEAAARVEATRLSRRPNLSLGLDSRQYSGDAGLRNGSATLSLSLPWFNGDRYRQDLLRDRLRFEAANRELADLEAEVAMEIHHWVTRIESARMRTELADGTLLPRIRTALDTATATLSAGSGDLREALDLHRQWLDAESARAMAVTEQWSAIAELMLTCGWTDLPPTAAAHPPSQTPSPSPGPASAPDRPSVGTSGSVTPPAP